MLTITASDLTQYLLRAAEEYNNPEYPVTWGFYKTSGGDVIVLTLYFALRIKNIDVFDIPPDSYFNVGDEIRRIEVEKTKGSIVINPLSKGWPFPFPTEMITSAIEKFRPLYKADFVLSNLINKMQKVDWIRYEGGARIILSKGEYLSGEFPIFFTDTDDSGNIYAIKNNIRIYPNMITYGRKCMLNTPYKAKNVQKINENTVQVDIIKKCGVMRLGVHCIDTPWYPDLKDKYNSLEEMDDEFIETTNSFSQFQDTEIPSINLHAKIFDDLLKVLVLSGSGYVEIFSSVIEGKSQTIIDQKTGETIIFNETISPSQTLIRNRQESPDMPLVEILLANLDLNTGVQL